MGRGAVDVKQVAFGHHLDGCTRALHRLVDGIVAAVHRRDERVGTQRDVGCRVVACIV